MKKILVVEDDLDVRESIIEILELNDFDVSGATNGKEGYDCINTENIDLILCDINMPEMNGYELLEKVKTEINGLPKFIFLTAKVEKQDVKKGLDMGILEYITKPFDHRYVVERIHYHLKTL
jgi:DNA-binding response OmpR family regulator